MFALWQKSADDVLGHELGHMFGCSHNREEYPVNSIPGTAFGKLLRNANGGLPGYRTVMA